jgi:hypothetical protein
MFLIISTVFQLHDIVRSLLRKDGLATSSNERMSCQLAGIACVGARPGVRE